MFRRHRAPTSHAMKSLKSRSLRTLSYSVFYEQAYASGFVAFVPSLPGCHTQGETRKRSGRRSLGPTEFANLPNSTK